ncbi:hypothetical protein AB5J52_38280 [Streptomyces sp. R39]|uniref:Uncharacterized protein n=1 Tax=Streptomyces sp. R39 TaxID=3238631 RepID=A0AB39QYI5_9ACTN
MLINAAICNFENNGGDRGLWQRMHDRLASPDSAASASSKVIDMKDLSDHHTVLVRLDRDTLTDVLNNPITRAA